MAVDELHFHRRRGLGRWERLGHPLDTLTMLACIGWTLVTKPTPANVARYVGLAIVSCLFVTKDEFVHARHCSGGEHWLHAVLFVVHPIALASVGLLWPGLHGVGAPGWRWLEGAAGAAHALPLQFGLTAAFSVYQIMYWNVRWLARAPLRS
jgi:hypothetical protein